MMEMQKDQTNDTDKFYHVFCNFTALRVCAMLQKEQTFFSL